MQIHRSIHLEPIYVVGSHGEFVEAISQTLRDTGAKYPDRMDLNVTHISHSMAFDPSGMQHWSAFVTVEVRSDKEDR